MKSGSNGSGPASEFGVEYFEYQHRPRSFLRRLARRIFLRKALSLTRGATLDFGCGTGELLALLPTGSLGIDINEHAVRHCRSLGLDAITLSELGGGTGFKGLGVRRFRTIILSHVLEHLPDAAETLRSVMEDSARLGAERIVVIVPGHAGFLQDETHRTFIDAAYLRAHGFLPVTPSGWRQVLASYFPVDSRRIAHAIPWVELQVVFERAE